MVHNTLQLFEQEFNQKNIEINYKITKSFKINADKHQIEQVIINLISNCLYAFEGIEKPMISINITSDKKRTHLSISDNGIGISEEIKGNIFIPYFTTRKDGSGIGLTLSKSIIEAHNGKIHFSSKKNETNFILTFFNKM